MCAIPLLSFDESGFGPAELQVEPVSFAFGSSVGRLSSHTPVKPTHSDDHTSFDRQAGAAVSPWRRCSGEGATGLRLGSTQSLKLAAACS
jgi:hypothetical protein